MGNLDELVPLDENYKKLFVHGHMSLFENSEYINTIFMKPVEGLDSYRAVLSNTDNVIFDETSDGLNINRIAKECSVETYIDYRIADINPYSFLFKRSIYDYSSVQKKGRVIEKEEIIKQVFLWEDGNLFRYAINSSRELSIEPMRYMHFQKRELIVDKSALSANRFIIIPNRVFAFERPIDETVINQYVKWKPIYPQYYKLKWRNLKRKIRNVL